MDKYPSESLPGPLRAAAVLYVSPDEKPELLAPEGLQNILTPRLGITPQASLDPRFQQRAPSLNKGAT